MSKKIFNGEVMTCKNCGWQFTARWDLESMWTAMEVDGHLFYYCPRCWGVPRWQWPKAIREAWDKDHPK